MMRTFSIAMVALVVLLAACGQQLRPPVPEASASAELPRPSAAPTDLFFSE